VSVGGEMHFDPIEVVPGKLLQYRQWAQSPDAGIETTVVFEDVEHGTRITFTQVGFGGPTRFGSEEVNRGMDETLADLVLYLEHGVHFARHRDVRSRSGLGAMFKRVPGGLGVTEVAGDSFASDIGIQPGDILLQLGGGSVFDHPDVIFFTRDHEAGEEVDAVYAHDKEVRRVRGRLRPFQMRAWEVPA
jgi:predicted metalloprotease with PDZ domain